MKNIKIIAFFVFVLGLVSLINIVFKSDSENDKNTQASATPSSDSFGSSLKNCSGTAAACLPPTSSATKYGSTERSSCLLTNAVFNKDVEYCQAISPAASRAHCASPGEEEIEAAKRSVGATSQYEVDDRDACFSDLAFLKQDKELCENIASPVERSVCLSYAETKIDFPNETLEFLVNNTIGGVTKRYRTIFGAGLNMVETVPQKLEICALIPDDLCVAADDVGQLKDLCTAAVAVDSRNIDLCFEIPRKESSCSQLKFNFHRANCIADTIADSSRPASLCDEIVQPEIRQSCYDRAKSAHN